jgi:hypothetical protein
MLASMRISCALVALASLATACSGTDGTLLAAPERTLSPSAGEDDAQSAPTPPLYLVATRVFSADETLGYITPTRSLDEPLDYSRALEIAGGGVLYASEGIGTFLIGAGEAPEITRYEVTEDDRLVPGQTLSFQNEGVIYLYAGSVIFVDEHKAYYTDLDQLQLIAFDPTDMVITGTVSLAEAERDGYFTSFGDAIVRDDGVYFPGQWFREPDWDRVPSGSLLVHVDPATNEVTMTADERCTTMLPSLTTRRGDTYWFSDMYNTYARRGHGPENGFPDCALRLRAGATTFDPNWELDVGSRTGGAATLAVLQGGDTSMWLRVLDEAAVDLPSPADFETLDTAPGWQWWLLDVESDAPAVRNDDRPLSQSSAIGMYVDGRAFTTLENEDYSETLLLELTERGFVERTTARGVIDQVARVR